MNNILPIPIYMIPFVDGYCLAIKISINKKMVVYLSEEYIKSCGVVFGIDNSGANLWVGAIIRINQYATETCNTLEELEEQLRIYNYIK